MIRFSYHNLTAAFVGSFISGAIGSDNLLLSDFIIPTAARRVDVHRGRARVTDLQFGEELAQHRRVVGLDDFKQEAFALH